MQHTPVHRIRPKLNDRRGRAIGFINSYWFYYDERFFFFFCYLLRSFLPERFPQSSRLQKRFPIANVRLAGASRRSTFFIFYYPCTLFLITRENRNNGNIYTITVLSILFVNVRYIILKSYIKLSRFFDFMRQTI